MLMAPSTQPQNENTARERKSPCNYLFPQKEFLARKSYLFMGTVSIDDKG